jgi:hypothetical protein
MLSMGNQKYGQKRHFSPSNPAYLRESKWLLYAIKNKFPYPTPKGAHKGPQDAEPPKKVGRTAADHTLANKNVP